MTTNEISTGFTQERFSIQPSLHSWKSGSHGETISLDPCNQSMTTKRNISAFQAVPCKDKDSI
jgi:hypothetical protein